MVQRRIERIRKGSEGRPAIKADRGARRPKRVSPAGLRQVGITKTVRAYVSKFKAKSRIDLVRQIVADVANFEKVDLPFKEAKALWAKRSATTVIKTRQVVQMDREKARLLKTPVIMGCTDMSFAIVAALRAANFNAWIVRNRSHTYCKFIYRNQIWIADATSPDKPKVRPMTELDKRMENMRRELGSFAEGPSFAQIGIEDYADFQKYDKP